MTTMDTIPEKVKRAALIRYEMNLLGLTGADIGRAAETHRSMVNREIQGAYRSRKVRQAIARAIEKPYSEVWGEE